MNGCKPSVGDSMTNQLLDQVQSTPPPPAIRQMADFYQKNGYYRASDLRRVLGDPMKAVEVGPTSSLAQNLRC